MMRIDGGGATCFPEVEPIFVVGAPRSGTTLLQQILNAHYDVSIYGEVHYFDQVLQLRDQIPVILNKEGMRQLFDNLPRVNAFDFLPGIDVRLRAVRKRLEQASAPGYELCYRYLLEQYAEEQGASRWGEKTPQNTRYLHELTAIFPNARIVHIVRDPRDVIASLRSMPWAPEGLGMNALKWKIDMLFIHQFTQEGNPVYELRYEDLITDPEPVLTSLCEFIGVPFDGAMLAFNQDAGKNIQAEPWKEGVRKRLNAGALGRWKRDLSDNDVFLVEMIVKPFLEKYGYQATAPTVVHRLLFPFYIISDAARYYRYRRREKRRRREQEQDVIYGIESKVKSRLLEAIFIRSL